LYRVVVVVFELATGANTGGAVVSYCLVVVVSVTCVVGVQAATPIIAAPAKTATAKLNLYLILQTPVTKFPCIIRPQIED
jgi:hypothetical protein